MEVRFKFALGTKVKLPNGTEGRVESNSIAKGMSVNRISVEYVDKEGTYKNRWFDETDLEEVK